MTDRKLTCVACKSAITEGDIAHSDLEFGGELKATNQPTYSADADTDLVATVGTLDEYTPMIRTTGNQTKAGTLTLTSGIVLKSYQAETIETSNTPRIGTNPTNTQIIMRLYKNAEDTDYVTRDTVYQSANNRSISRIWYLQRQNEGGTGVETISLSLGFTAEGRATLTITDSQGTRSII